MKSLRLIALGALIPAVVALSGCSPASQEHFETLGNAICTNTAKSIAAQKKLIDSGDATGDAAALVSLDMIKAHRAEASAFERLTAPVNLQAGWDATIAYINTTADVASDRLAGRDVDSNLLHTDHQAQFHLTMSAFGLDACATRGDEWPGQSAPVGGGANDAVPSAGTGSLLPGVAIDGYMTAPDPATARDTPSAAASKITP